MLPEDIIKYILSFAPDFHDNYKKCHKELLENKHIYYSKIVKSCFEKDIPKWLAYFAGNTQIRPDPISTAPMPPGTRKMTVTVPQVITKGMKAMGVTDLLPHSIEISRQYHFKNEIDPFRYITINYGWGREKNHKWVDILYPDQTSNGKKIFISFYGIACSYH